MTKVKEFSFSTEHQVSGREMIRLAKLAEDLGYGTFWVPEDPFYRGPFTSMATIAAHTTNMRVGSIVINPRIRHPVSIAMEMSALDDYSEGRAILGLSPGAMWLNQLNIASQKQPLTTLRESIDIIQPLIRGETVHHESDLFTVSDVTLTIPPHRPNIPLYMGVRGPKSLQLCGERGDGLLLALTLPITTTNLSYTLENLKIGAARSGRDLSDLDITWMMTLSMSDNDREARDRVKPLVLRTLLANLENGGGYKFENSEIPPSFYADLQKAVDGAGDPMDLITDDIIDRYAIAGSPARCKEGIARLVDAGINSFILTDYSNYGMPEPMDIETAMRDCQEHLMSEFL